ncbi:MAG: alanine--tRNA ligase [Candidatus Aenigmarchaeota archaeon]|nr:alanine--tRNA ligase [Candidatus Aenigmarchaeota archaeon]
MGDAKQRLREMFSASYKQHYEVRLFKEQGFARKVCKSCGRAFWTFAGSKDICGDSKCQTYTFIGKQVTKKSFDYIESWKQIEKFFVKNGHASIQRYPVLCRWFPDLYFTIAGIVDFQRMDGNKTVFELPANPLILPQPCLRFNDIPNVGITGRHNTTFIMVQQTAMYDGKNGYWKDQCIDLDFRLLTEVFGIAPQEITFLEDVWMGPNAFGPSLEYYAHGLELGNAVFTQFLGNADRHEEMQEKVIDMGAGLERFAWVGSKASTSYEPVFGPVVGYMKKQAGIKDTAIFDRYALLAGRLDFESPAEVKAGMASIAKELGISQAQMREAIEPLQAIYAIADHTKTLLLAIADGGIPSNVGAGHNLRVILRRSQSFINRFGFDISLEKVAKMHARHLKPLYPELKDALDKFAAVVGIEKERQERSMEKASAILQKELEKGIDAERMAMLYTTHGITPELMESAAQAAGKPFAMPTDFYTRLTEMHMQAATHQEKRVGLPTLPSTKLLFYDRPMAETFTAKVLHAAGNRLVLDQTLFYPEGGGQAADGGVIDGAKVTDVQTEDGIVVHTLEKSLPLRASQEVAGKIDLAKRQQHMQHHTGIHIVNGAARHVIGAHVWQAGSRKTAEKASLDVTHYRQFSEAEIAEMERQANAIVGKNLAVKKHVMPRPEAEQKFGLRIYQGGPAKSKTLRLVEIPGWDVEACGGTHWDHTADVGRIIILGSERIQDGVNRLTIKAGKEAERFLDENQRAMQEIIGTMSGAGLLFAADIAHGDKAAAYQQVKQASSVFDVEPAMLKQTVGRFLTEIAQDRKTLADIAARSKSRPKPPGKIAPFQSLQAACDYLFALWKEQKKEMAKAGQEFAAQESERLLKLAKGGMVCSVINASREEMISVGSIITGKQPDLAVLLANQKGEVVGIGKGKDMAALVREVCQKANGSGGGRPDFAQGKGDAAKLAKVLAEMAGK